MMAGIRRHVVNNDIFTLTIEQALNFVFENGTEVIIDESRELLYITYCSKEVEVWQPAALLERLAEHFSYPLVYVQQPLSAPLGSHFRKFTDDYDESMIEVTHCLGAATTILKIPRTACSLYILEPPAVSAVVNEQSVVLADSPVHISNSVCTLFKLYYDIVSIDANCLPGLYIEMLGQFLVALFDKVDKLTTEEKSMIHVLVKDTFLPSVPEAILDSQVKSELFPERWCNNHSLSDKYSLMFDEVLIYLN